MKKGRKSKSRSKSKKEKKPVTEEEDSKEDLASENDPQSPNLYSLLGVEKTATNAEIKKAYRRLVFMYHPDKNKTDPDAGAKFANISRAYKILSNPDRRKIYDDTQVIMMMKMKKKLISLKHLIISEKFIIQKILKHSKRNI